MNPDEEQFSGNRGSVKGNSYHFAAKAYAFLKGRGYVTPQDVKSIGMVCTPLEMMGDSLP